MEQIYGKNATVADLQRPLEDWEFNPRCRRSIKGRVKKTETSASDHDKIASNNDSKLLATSQLENVSIRKEQATSQIAKQEQTKTLIDEKTRAILIKKVCSNNNISYLNANADKICHTYTLLGYNFCFS